MSVDFDALMPRSPIVFEPLVPKSLRVANWRFATDIPFTDPVTGESRRAMGVILDISEEDGVKVNKPWNLIARNAIQDLRPTLDDGSFRERLYTVTKSGAGRTARYTVQVGPAVQP